MIRAREYPDKAALRRALRARRAALSTAERRRASRQLLRLALRHRLLMRKRRAGFYVPTRHEIDVLPLLERALALGAACFLPIVPGRGRKKLWFTRLGERPAWFVNRYGIPEYHPPAPRKCRAGSLETLFLPLLGFDAEGWRIGMGGGYYDASLAALRIRRHWRKPRLIGVAYAVQEVDRVPRDAWDVPLDGILTERRYLAVRGKTRKTQ
jgi:5-formyltetrahydrofolate cyclo-ligase